MINIRLWENNNQTKDNELVQILKKSFNITQFYQLNLVKNKTFIISLIANDKVIGTISLLPNDDLIEYLKKSGTIIDSVAGTYSFKALKGIYIYNLAVISEFRNKGFAQKLIEIAMYVSRTKKFEYCHTHCENNISEHIFSKLGFKMENVFKNEKNQSVKLMTSWLK